MLSHGHASAYCTESYGRRLILHTFEDFQKQCFRWAYGAIQILKHHRGVFFQAGRLSLAQRSHFLVGWLPWIIIGIALLLTLTTLAWSVAMVIAPAPLAPAPWLLTLPVLLSSSSQTCPMTDGKIAPPGTHPTPGPGHENS
ncbi:hypothetical protein LZ023_11615 [Pseudomonas silvicola]|nr:hypothetical protein LZ023_11615 [Pseudomonas silvicola]